MVGAPHRGGWRDVVCPGLVGLGLLLQGACMTPERADRQAGEAGARLATAYWQAQTGATNAFDAARPSDALTLRLALMAMARGEEGVAFPHIPDVSAVPADDDVWRLSLADALSVAARNDRPYQRLKEEVFKAALDLDSQQFLFETSFTGLLLGLLSGGSGVAEEAAGSAGAGLQRQFANGATIAGQLALDVVSLLRSDWNSVGLTGDLSMAVPLMRGSGRAVVREPLTQAERNLMYAVRRFEHYRQTYAVAVTAAYFGVLEYAQRLKNAQDNEVRLTANRRRARRSFRRARAWCPCGAPTRSGWTRSSWRSGCRRRRASSRTAGISSCSRRSLRRRRARAGAASACSPTSLTRVPSRWGGGWTWPPSMTRWRMPSAGWRSRRTRSARTWR